MEWVDTARGIAIIAVVVYHAALFLSAAGWGGAWLEVMSALETFRMPLFFFAAGLFSAKILTQSFGDLWRKRLALFLYLYVLWSLIRVLFFQFVPFVVPSSDASDWREFLMIFVWPNGGLWFIYALSIFSVFVWGLRKAPPWVPIGISLVVSFVAGSGIVSIGNTSWTKTGMYMFFFVASIYLRDRTFTAVTRASSWAGVALVVLYAGATVAFVFLPRIPGVRLMISIIGVAAGITIAVFLSRFAAFSWVTYLGRTTLPIYLVHYLPVAAVAAVLASLSFMPSPAMHALATPIVSVVAVAISLGVYSVFRRVHGIFDLPKFRAPRASVTER